MEASVVIPSVAGCPAIPAEAVSVARMAVAAEAGVRVACCPWLK